MNAIVPQPNQQHPVPFGAGRGLQQTGAINQGAVTVEVERAIAEAQGKLTLAKRFPRDLNAAHAELMMACKSPAFAAVAFYNKPQGGSTITGPSIRMAEQIAQVYGNFDYGHRELSRDDAKSEVEIYAWDMEKNNYTRRQLTVLHVIDTRDGPKKMRDQTQIDSKVNNVASKQSRGLILAMMPKWLVEDAVQECRKTIAGNNEEPLDVRVRKMTQAFSKFGVKAGHLEKYLGHSLDAVLLDELVDLTGIYNSLKDGTPASDIFGLDEEAAGTTEAAGLAQSAKASAAAAPAAQPAAAETKPPARRAPAAKTAEAKTAPAPAAEVQPDPAPQPDPDPAPVQADASADNDPPIDLPPGPGPDEDPLF